MPDRGWKGEAHKIFEETSRRGETIVKKQLGQIVERLHRQMKVHFVSKARLNKFVQEQFSAYDTNGDKRLDLEEFLAFYTDWIAASAEDAIAQNRRNQDEAEQAFLAFDQDRNFALSEDEVVAFLRNRRGAMQSGFLVPDQQLEEISRAVIAKHDADKSGKLEVQKLGDSLEPKRPKFMDAIASPTG